MNVNRSTEDNLYVSANIDGSIIFDSSIKWYRLNLNYEIIFANQSKFHFGQARRFL